MWSNDHHSDKEWISFGIVSVHRGAAWQRHREPDTTWTTTSTVLLLASGDTVQTWWLVSPGPHVIVNWSLNFSCIFLVFTHDHIKFNNYAPGGPFRQLCKPYLFLVTSAVPKSTDQGWHTMCDVLLVRGTVTLRSAILVLLSQDCVVHTDDSTRAYERRHCLHERQTVSIHYLEFCMGIFIYSSKLFFYLLICLHMFLFVLFTRLFT